MRIPLGTSGSVTIDGAGRGVVYLTPQAYGETWFIRRMVTAATNPVKLRVYTNVEMDSALLDSTHAGHRDTSETNIVVESGTVLMCVYSEGTPGDICTINLSGDKETGRY